MRLFKRAKKILKPYDPKTHWKNRGRKDPKGGLDDPNKLQQKIDRVNLILDVLKPLEFKSVLDFGCGWGFVTKHILDNFEIDQYTAFDASPDRIRQAKIDCQEYDVDFQVSMLDEFHSDKKFDLVIGTGVLHFVPPEHIKDIMKKMMNYGEKYFVHEDPPFDPSFENSKSYHTFMYDFEKIWNELEYDVNIIPNPKYPPRSLYYIKK